MKGKRAGKKRYHDADAYKTVSSRRKKIVEMERHLDNLHAGKYAREQRQREIRALKASLKAGRASAFSRTRIPNKKKLGTRYHPIVLD